jgi:hypothetical protein
MRPHLVLFVSNRLRAAASLHVRARHSQELFLCARGTERIGSILIAPCRRVHPQCLPSRRTQSHLIHFARAIVRIARPRCKTAGVRVARQEGCEDSRWFAKLLVIDNRVLQLIELVGVIVQPGKSLERGFFFESKR